jgi:hydroxylamine reductase (hybrid-cluster protein)
LKPKYTINDHKHNFAIWTAARAVQRNFTTTKIIGNAINSVHLQEEVIKLEKSSIVSEEYDSWHYKMVQALIKNFPMKEGEGVKLYGRAAKIIAIYLKTYHIVGNPTSSLSKVAHPPVDRVLLSNLYKENKDLKILNVIETAWTNINSDQYFEIIVALKHIQSKNNFEYFWMMEYFWNTTND